MKVKIRVLNNGRIPQKMTDGSVGWDCFAAESIMLKPLQATKVPLGFQIEMGDTMAADLRARSSLSLKNILIANAPGTIDRDYRGEVCAIMMNLNQSDFMIDKGDRVCQLVFLKELEIVFKPYKHLHDTDRGTCGFGSTGIGVYGSKGTINDGSKDNLDCIKRYGKDLNRDGEGRSDENETN